MAVIILSPWPSTADSVATAISALKDAVKPGASNAEIERLGLVSSVRVEQYAPGAPDVIRTEALIRYAGYLYEAGKSDFGATRGKSRDLGSGFPSVQNDNKTDHAVAFRHSGAAALLSPWKRRRAGAIGGAGSRATEQTTMPSQSQQLPPVTLSESPADIADGLSAGNYEFQMNAESNPSAVVLYSYGDTAPAGTSAYFTARAGDTVEFTVTTGTRLWARVWSNEQPATLAIARV